MPGPVVCWALGDALTTAASVDHQKPPVTLHATQATRISTFAEGSIKRASEPAPWPPRQTKPWDSA
ncbi:hypothetical protein M441DRAFT_53821 [Trichoderma asperellum CBS 433.97]|uniref:Uncharacterized protein n=1 Tax=Trichoderma asperellum (strain ATCC 204424 / CBS 433.97 / NBRC 101777) TaxID=1042311 RepID=A0A2T3ZQR6_TRIA4|nr:hypothetical protein M441DRAFT_53821 [Trichoderma asperellum CBS 433.97]PTB47146.1 hypothetical protein M441DRAFT_53821 [Trichoderma asperellum CBS 433.97]